MKKMVSINDLEKIGGNLYRRGKYYYRLFGKSITPNGCWVIAPEIRELLDIDISTGRDVYGRRTLEICGGITGTVEASAEYLGY